MGKCPECRMQIGPLAIFLSWDNFGKFVCPGCGKNIRFSSWFLTVFALFALFIFSERMLHFMLISNLPLWLSFIISTMLAVLVMFIVPMIWRFQKN